MNTKKIILLLFLLLTVLTCHCRDLDYIHPDKVEDRRRSFIFLNIMTRISITLPDCLRSQVPVNLVLAQSETDVAEEREVRCYTFTASAQREYQFTLTMQNGDADLFISEPGCVPYEFVLKTGEPNDEYCSWDYKSWKLGLETETISVNFLLNEYRGIGVRAWKESEYSLIVE